MRTPTLQYASWRALLRRRAASPRPWPVIATVLACLLLPSGTALGQDRVALDGRAGIAIPAGGLAKMEGVGASAGGGIAVRVYRDLSLRFALDADMLEGKRLASGEVAPGVNLYHFLIGAEWEFASARMPLVATAVLGAGSTMLDVEAFVIPQGQPGAGETPLIQEYYPAVHGGMQLGYRLGRRVEVALDARAYRVFADEDETAAVATLSEEVEALGAVWTFPITLQLDLWLF